MHSRTVAIRLGVFLTATLLPTQALANTGTPLMWASAIHLLFGNLLIGLLEGFILAKFFRVGLRRALPLMIAANYASAWIGAALMPKDQFGGATFTLENIQTVISIFVAAAFLLTLLLEFPFVWLVLRRAPNAVRRSIRASLAVQPVSYLLLFGWYYAVSSTPISYGISIVEPSAISMPDNVVLYYIASEDGDVYAQPLGNNAAAKIHDLESTRRYDRLLVRPCEDDPTRWRLVARRFGNRGDDEEDLILETVLDNLKLAAAPIANEDRSTSSMEPSTWMNFGEVPRLGAAAESRWRFHSGFWAIEGLRGQREDTGDRIRFAIETPLVRWNIRNAVHLPEDKVVFQLGADQTCVFDVEGRRVALIARGCGPTVVLTAGRKQGS